MLEYDNLAQSHFNMIIILNVFIGSFHLILFSCLFNQRQLQYFLFASFSVSLPFSLVSLLHFGSHRIGIRLSPMVESGSLRRWSFFTCSHTRETSSQSIRAIEALNDIYLLPNPSTHTRTHRIRLICEKSLSLLLKNARPFRLLVVILNLFRRNVFYFDPVISHIKQSADFRIVLVQLLSQPKTRQKYTEQTEKNLFSIFCSCTTFTLTMQNHGICIKNPPHFQITDEKSNV